MSGHWGGPGCPTGKDPGCYQILQCTGRLRTTNLLARMAVVLQLGNPELIKERRKMECSWRGKSKEVGLCVGFRWGMGKIQ